MQKFYFCLISLHAFKLGISVVGKAVNCEAFALPEPPCCGRSRTLQTLDARIYHGEIAKLNEFPWMAYLTYKLEGQNPSFCGGSLINARWILTAAHCLPLDDVKRYTIHLGEWNLQTDPDCLTPTNCASKVLKINIERIIKHPSYGGVPVHDIALISLVKSITFNNFIQPICLAYKDWNNQIQTTGTLTGWGQIEEHKESFVLRKIKMHIMSLYRCRKLQNEFAITEYHICAGGGTSGACFGDSGGPLSSVQIRAEETQNISYHFQIGVFSAMWSLEKKCGLDLRPDIFMKVSAYLDWIKYTIRKY